MARSLKLADYEHTVVTKNKYDIIYELTSDLEEQAMYNSIISNLEKTASDYVKDGKIAQLPFIGKVRIDPIKEFIRANHVNFREAKSNMNESEYREHVRTIINNEKDRLRVIKEDSKQVKTLISKYKAKYDRLYISLGKGYADMFINSLLWLRPVKFDIDVQEMYDSFNN